MSKNEEKFGLLSTNVYLKYTTEENAKKIPLYTKSKKMHDFRYNWETNIRNRKTAVFLLPKWPS